MLIGHKKQWEYLKKLAEADKIPHAFLFSGPEKIGKKTLAIQWLSSLFGISPGQFALGGYPDLALVEPQEPEAPSSSLRKAQGEGGPSTARQEIKIPQIRELIWKLSMKPHSSLFKAAIIDQAHLMNQEAQTSLLKTLEEPKGKTILILVTEYPDSLFPTILSRVQAIKFLAVKDREIRNYLKEKGIDEETQNIISQMSMGKPGRAVELASDGQALLLAKARAKEAMKVCDSDLAVRFQYAKSLSDNPQIAREVLAAWLGHFRNMLLSKTAGKEEKHSLLKLKAIIKALQETIFSLSNTNVNFRLALESLMLEF